MKLIAQSFGSYPLFHYLYDMRKTPTSKLKFTNYNYQAQQYCFHNNIKICPMFVSKGNYRIEINNQGNISVGNAIYSSKDVFKKIWELYEFFYNQK